jgi:hypothetical protein
MKVRLLKTWGWYKVGDVADVFEPLGANWIQTGIAEAVREDRSMPVERADEVEDRVERAVVSEKRRVPKERA